MAFKFLDRPTPATGTVLGLDRKGRARVYDGDAHMCIVGPSRCGKGVNSIVPTLLTKPGSVVVLDVKSELWQLTAGRRAQMGHVAKFDPCSANTIHLNPWLQVRQETEIKDTQQIAECLVAPNGESLEHPHWAENAKSLLICVGLHQLYAGNPPDKSFGGILRFLTAPDRSRKDMFAVLMSTNHLGHGPHPTVHSIAQGMMNRPGQEQASIVSTLERMLALWRDPAIDRATTSNDLFFRDLQYGERPLSLYLCTPPSDLIRLQPLLRMLWTLLVRELTEQLPPATAHPLTLLMDEFASLGRMELIESTMPYLAGYKIQLVIVLQSLNQLDKHYGTHSSILENCAVKVVFRPNDERTAQRVSVWVGQYFAWLQQVSHSEAYSTQALLPFGRTISNSAGARETLMPLLRTDQVLQLPSHKVLVFFEGQPAWIAAKLLYYQEPRWHQLITPAPQHASTLARQHLRNPWYRYHQPVPVVTPSDSREAAIEAEVEAEVDALFDDYERRIHEDYTANGHKGSPDLSV